MAQINKPSEYFNTKLYSGSGSTTTLTGVGFQPDWTWIKRRNSSINHKIYDAVRTAGKSISSNNPAAEITNDAEGYLSAFTSDGFTVQAGTTSDEYVNQTGGTYVSWNWKANGAGASNTDGSITSTVSADTTSGFSIVKWTPTIGSAQSIGHGLGTVPKVIIQKPINGSAADWVVGGFGLDWSGYLLLDTTLAFNNDSNDTSGTGRMFSAGGTDPTANVWYTDSGAITGDATSMIAYCFAEKKGFSKFGTYRGGVGVDGPFIYTGFKPAFVMIKSYDGAYGWVMNDNKRNPYNEAKNTLFANNTDVEDPTYNTCDLLSNGFKLRSSAGASAINSATNDGTLNYIYMAFAEEPLVGTNNIPATAR